MLWAALLPHYRYTPARCTDRSAAAQAAPANMAGLALWALQFTPRVACVPSATAFGDALVLELSASERLFGGKPLLAHRIQRECQQQDVHTLAWAPTSLGAIALARSGMRHGGYTKPLADALDPLPLASLDAMARHAETLARLGCTSLGQVRALPRGGLVRRFDAALLAALDRAYGLQPDGYDWIALPAQFHARLELPLRVEHADALMHGAHRLVLQLCGWLAAQRAGIRHFSLHWCHDAMRSKHAGDGGELQLHTATTTRDASHLSRLLQEHLAHVQLLAPVGELELRAAHPEPLTESSASLLPDKTTEGESLDKVLERISARLGSHQVQRPLLHADHRPEWQVQWQAASAVLPPAPAPLPPVPQPSFLLNEPLRLLQDSNSQPLYQGPLRMLAGPQRIEGGWWHRSPGFLPPAVSGSNAPPPGQCAHTALRDYWLAHSPHAGLLWIYHTRLNREDSAWFLHGLFA